MATVYVGLGSNLNDPKQQIETAIQNLAQSSNMELLAQSSLYSNPPMGAAQQPDYVNAVVCLDTRHSPLQLLDKLQAIEAQQGRKRGIRWASRTLDLDILLYENELIDSERLKIPHPGLCERNFVLYPLLEIAPELIIPAQGRLSDLIKHPDIAVLSKL